MCLVLWRDGITAYSEVTVLTKKPSVAQAELAAANPKRGGGSKKKTSKQQVVALVPPNPDFVCHRIVSIDVGGDRRVELKRQTIEEGSKILLGMSFCLYYNSNEARRWMGAHGCTCSSCSH